MSDPTPPPAQSEGSLLPAILGGAGILALAGLLIFWPSGSENDPNDGNGVTAGAAAADRAGGPGQGAIPPRSYDEATREETPSPRINPAIRLPGLGMSPNPPPPQEPPQFETKDQELRWHEAQLEKAERMLAFREKAMGRLEQIRQEIESNPEAADGMRTYEQRAKIVRDNLDTARADVDRLKKKIAELQQQ